MPAVTTQVEPDHGLVTVTQGGGSYRVELTAPGWPPVTLGPYHNLSVVKDKADAIRGFIAAVLQSPAGPTPRPMGKWT